MANGFVQVPVDSTGKKIQTFENVVGGNTVEAEAVVLVDNTGANACNVNGSGQLPVAVGNTPSVNQGTSPWLTRQNDGTNTETTLFDVDSSGVTHQFVQGVSLRKTGSGGSVELGTATNPVRVDPTGTTTQPVSGTVTANQGGAPWSENITQLGGNSINTGSGVIGTGTARVVIATDQPQLTNALKVDGSAVTQPVSGTVTANAGTGTFNNQQSNVTADYDTGVGTQTMTMFGMALPASGGAVAGGTATNPIQVSVANTGANATAIKVDGSAVTQPINSSTATGSAVPANAYYMAGDAATALPAAATAGNLTGLMMDKFGRPVCVIGSIRDLTGTQTTTISASTAETTIVTAAASTFNDLVMLIVSNTSASTNTRIDFRDTTAGTILFSLQSVGGAAPIGFALPVPIPQTTVNTNWTAQCASSTTDIRIYAVFVKNK